MSLVLAWVAAPLLLAALGAGWGAIVERAAGTTVPDALLIPLGLAAALVVAGTATAFSFTAPAAVSVVAVGAAVGLFAAWPGGRLWNWGLIAAAGVLLAYGAPVLLSGQATFTGFVRLDDTSTWFNIVDHVFSHAGSVSSESESTYSLVFTGDVGSSYPLGAFMLPGVVRGVLRTDVAWIFQPYLACCGAAIALCVWSMFEQILASARVRALLAFAAAQPALLYGYSLWGGIKELTAAFLLVLGVALAAGLLQRRPSSWRALLPLALATGALIQTLGPGAAGWVAPALVVLIGSWLWRKGPFVPRRAIAGSLASLAVETAAFAVPVWLVLAHFLSNASGLFSSGQTQATKLGNLIKPLSAFQLVGIWPIGDFRLTAPTLASALLIGLALLAALFGLWVSARRREPGVALYVAVALSGCGVLYASDATPWVIGKALAISSPALLVAALGGAALLWRLGETRRIARLGGAAVTLALVGGVLWSNVLGYGDATLAPRARLAELSHIGKLVRGAGPTFVNEYEIYADRHFLRAGAPVEPAEYRTATLPTWRGSILTKAAAADLDSFALATLEPYRSIVTRRSPAESRPPSNYRLIWHGRYYQLWQRPARPASAIIEHIALGESGTLPYCGVAQGGPTKPLCSVDPVATPPCSWLQGLARQAAREHAELLAYMRPEPIVARGDQTLWPAAWYHDPSGHSLSPTRPGEAVSHIAVASRQRYGLWLGGSFARGFRVSVDGRYIGVIKDELSSINGYVHVADVALDQGVHAFALEYPHPNLTEIGRASCRERVDASGAAVPLNKHAK